MYKRNHTGAINQDGGVNDGFNKSVYQLRTESLVKMEPMKPALKQPARLINRRKTSCSLVSFTVLRNLRGFRWVWMKTSADALQMIY